MEHILKPMLKSFVKKIMALPFPVYKINGKLVMSRVSLETLNIVTSIKISEQALGTMSQGSGSIWIGAKRTTLCKASRLSKYCNTLTSFQWTDGSASGLDGLIWNNNQPDNNYNRTDQCVVLLAARTPTVSDDLQWGANRLDDCCM